MSQLQHPARTGNRHLKGFKRISAVVIRRGNTGGVNDVIQRSIPIERLGDIVVNETDIIELGDFSAFFARRDKVIESYQGYRLI